MGISPHQHLSGEYIIDNKCKAEILNKQYVGIAAGNLCYMK
jgi:hypothetical protein